MTLYKWSQTAASDASADSTINWAEGMAPSAVNDSARAMMAAIAKWRDDMGPNLQTAGTSTAYTLTSNQVFDTLANMGGKEIAFFAHATNGASPTLNVDGLGAYPIVIDGAGTAVPSATLVSGAVYTVVFSYTASQFRLKDFYQLPFTVPVGGMIDYFGTSAPSSNFVFPYGQAISRTTYSVLFGLVGTTYGTGDGSTTFNVPDLRGRAVFGKDDMGGSAAGVLSSTYYNATPTTLGAKGGFLSNTLLTTHLPPYTPAGSISNGAITVSLVGSSFIPTNTGTTISNASPSGAFGTTGSASASQAASTFAGTAQGGASTPFSNVPPGMITNKLLRII